MLRWAVGLVVATVLPSVPAVPPGSAELVPTLSQPAGGVRGLASWYGGGEPLNEFVAMGHRFNPDALEAAMWDVPFGSLMKVTNLDTGRFVVVRITDRGPSRRFPDRVIDLTRGSFERIAPLERGLVPVRVERIS
ncbi:MAG: septal ring lytic transglycosylase RlpA family lipoprotein [Candidatus Omnitrophica bacterium]|nr:septal ring lytic transglycosylase RlpA family lipoprotein [Candidatus Omnitrophota bacterium]